MSAPDFLIIDLPAMLVAVLAAASCGLLGNFLVLRRQALIGDAISHVALPGIVVGFLVAGEIATFPLMLGAMGAAILAAVLIETIRRVGGLESGAAMGVVFTTMDDLKEHYRSDWHRYNLKRKVAGLPVVGKDLFERVMQQAAGAAGDVKRTGRSHLKRPEQEPRSVAKAKRLETWIEHHRDEIEAAQAAMEARERRWAAGVREG